MHLHVYFRGKNFKSLHSLNFIRLQFMQKAQRPEVRRFLFTVIFSNKIFSGKINNNAVLINWYFV